jgi:hypothetical protein
MGQVLTDLQLLAVAVLRGDTAAAYALADAVTERAARPDGYVPYADLVRKVADQGRRLSMMEAGRHPWVGRRCVVRVYRRFGHPDQSESDETGSILEYHDHGGPTFTVRLDGGAVERWVAANRITPLD